MKKNIIIVLSYTIFVLLFSSFISVLVLLSNYETSVLYFTSILGFLRLFSLGVIAFLFLKSPLAKDKLLIVIFVSLIIECLDILQNFLIGYISVGFYQFDRDIQLVYIFSLILFSISALQLKNEKNNNALILASAVVLINGFIILRNFFLFIRYISFNVAFENSTVLIVLNPVIFFFAVILINLQFILLTFSKSDTKNPNLKKESVISSVDINDIQNNFKEKQKSFCVKCGTQKEYPNGRCEKCGYQPPLEPQRVSSDVGGIGWGLLGFFIPLVGIILYLVWKEEKPKTSKDLQIGAIVGMLIGGIGFIFYLIIIFILFDSMGGIYI